MNRTSTLADPTAAAAGSVPAPADAPAPTTVPSRASAAATRTQVLAERLLGSFVAGAELLTVDLGRRLGLYTVLAESGPTTPAGLARAAGIPERYAREWLEQQGAAGILDVAGEEDGADAHGRTFTLPAAHVPVVLDPESPAHALGLAPLLQAVAGAVPAVADAVGRGSGVPYPDFGPDLPDAIATITRSRFALLLPAWVRHLPDVAARLDAGGTVLDVGCGHGWSTVALARTFPHARVVGVDLDPASAEAARRTVATAGLSGRVRIVTAAAEDSEGLRDAVDGPVDLVTVFQALHDLGSPVAALRAVRSVLAPDGAVLVGDEAGAATYEAPGDDRTRLQYAISVLHCLPATWAQDPSAPNGTVLRPATVDAWARAAGFGGARELTIEHPFWRFFRL